MLTNRDWAKVHDSYVGSAPSTAAVVDDFLESSALRRIREELLSHWGWQYRNPRSKELFLRDPELDEISRIGAELSSALPRLLHGLYLVRCWAFLYTKNTMLGLHSDDGVIAVNLWLTPTEFNLSPATGGLIISNVKRPVGAPLHEFNSPLYAENYLARHQNKEFKTIEYKYNRAVIFDARLFHRTDSINFSASTPSEARMSLSMVFDDPLDHSRERSVYLD